MSDKARKLIAQAIKLHLDEDGASEIGAYRDVVTEVLHFAKKKFTEHSSEGLFHDICDEGYDAFMEELELGELDKLKKIKDKDLPLHKMEEFEFDSIKKMFEERIKGGADGKKKN